MRPSDDNFGFTEEKPGQNLAVLAEALFLINLLLAPGIGFAILLWLWLQNKDSAPPLARQHLKQTTFVSLWGGLLIVSLTALLILVGGLYWNTPGSRSSSTSPAFTRRWSSSACTA